MRSRSVKRFMKRTLLVCLSLGAAFPAAVAAQTVAAVSYSGFDAAELYQDGPTASDQETVINIENCVELFGDPSDEITALWDMSSAPGDDA